MAGDKPEDIPTPLKKNKIKNKWSRYPGEYPAYCTST